MKIKDIIIYPVKGMAGISVPSAMTTNRGFQHDRTWMLVNAEGKFITQREYASMALFKTKIDSSELVVEFEGDEISIPLVPSNSSKQRVKVWRHIFDATLVSDHVDQWFSNKLNMECRMVYMGPDDKRHKSLIKAPRKTELSFADGYPYLIIGTASFDGLQSKLEEPIAINRFRANIIIETTDPHCEERWDFIEVGGAVLKMIKPCARCPVVNINQETGESTKSVLKTLSTYRKMSSKVYFGMNTVSIEDGEIKVGDFVLVNGR